MRFGKLEVIKRDSNSKSGCSKWECLCDCGNIKIIEAGNLKNGHTQSCGCFRKEKMRQISRREPGQNGFSTLKNKYKKNARLRNLSWNLNDKQLKELFKGNCYYCNIEPIQISRAERYSTPEADAHSQFIYNGIDRLNNNIGYEYINCVPSCKMCNWMKLNFLLEDFLNKIKQIAKHKLGLK